MNLKEKKTLAAQLYKKWKTQRNSQMCIFVARDISEIIRKLKDISEEKSIETKGCCLFFRRITNSIYFLKSTFMQLYRMFKMSCTYVSP